LRITGALATEPATTTLGVRLEVKAILATTEWTGSSVLAAIGVGHTGQLAAAKRKQIRACFELLNLSFGDAHLRASFCLSQRR